MNSRLLFGFLIVAVVFVSGCTEVGNIVQSVSLKDITQSPDSYVDKEVTLEIYTSPSFPMDSEWLRSFWMASDDQGYEIRIKPFIEENRHIGTYQHYRITGLIKSIDTCTCEQKRTFFDKSTFGWEGYKGQYNSVYPIDTCDNREPETPDPSLGTILIEYRCKPDSYDTTYYIEVTEPMTKI